MSSEELGLVPPPPPQNGLTSQQLLFPVDSSLRFARVGDPCPKARDLGSTTGFIEDRFFASQNPDFRGRSLYPNGPDLRDPPLPPPLNWNGSDTRSGDATDGNDDDDDDDDDEEDDDDDVDEGPVGEVTVKDGNSVQASSRAISTEIQHQGRMGNYQNAVTVAEPDGELYYAQYLRETEVTTSGRKDVVESHCGFSGRKEVAFHSESGDSLRAILSDPLTGDLMDDAVVLPCGHSFGSGGIQRVIGMKACSTCSRPISEDSILPNLSLRAAVQAFRHEEELLLQQRSSKRRRERFDQDKGIMYGAADRFQLDPSRGSRGLQFPFAAMDRVIIKGNKRTPPRFVGREAIVTTQCLNGWYVVKTLDNAESVKLQYRSLAKVVTHGHGGSSSSSKPPTTSSKMAPPWL